MASFEILSGDFEREIIRIRYSDAGRAFVRLTGDDGVAEDLFLAREVVGAATAGEGRVAELLARWAEREPFARDLVDLGRPGGERGEGLFVVLLRDGRKFVARGTPDTVAEIKSAAVSESRRGHFAEGLDAARGASRSAVGGLLPRLVPGLFARWLPNR